MTTAEEHKQAMQALQAEQKAKVASSEYIERGLVLVHTGDGKGKSSSAFGVTCRALGWGHQVGVVQFIKGTWKTGEREFFKRFPDQLTWETMGEGFTWNTQDRDRDIAAATAAFDTATAMMSSGDFDLIVLDEINIALRYDYLDIKNVISSIEQRSTRSSVILTGRDAKAELMDMADLVSEMKEIKHPFKSGIKAKQGIDF
ncbi:MAG: cob(I)yrinic acid a,c-diamide adenosyltransferase [Granulosicoccus sp.]